jgi:hypothetical protein
MHLKKTGSGDAVIPQRGELFISFSFLLHTRSQTRSRFADHPVQWRGMGCVHLST